MKGSLACFGMMGTLSTYSIGFSLATRYGILSEGWITNFLVHTYYTSMAVYLGIMILAVIQSSYAVDHVG